MAEQQAPSAENASATPHGDEPAETQQGTGGVTDGTTNEIDTSQSTKASNLCGVCEKVPSKYKCPRCYLPYCSVACNKIHRENHPPDAPKPAPQLTEPPLPAPPAESATNNQPEHPFGALQSSDKLQWLFKKYPRLPGLLLDIHAATQEPPVEKPKIPASLLKDLPPRNNGWNREKGIAHGKEALRKARGLEGEDGEAIREYSELVLYLMDEGARSTRGR